jgi:hypothetical protein
MKCIKGITGLVVVLYMSLAVAQPPKLGGRGESHHLPPVAPFGPSGGMHGGMNAAPMILDVAELQSMLKQIGINAQTIDKVVGTTRNFMTEFEGKLIRVQREELSIKEELLKEKPDLKAIQNYIAKKTAVFAEIEFAQIKRDIEIKSMLTRDEYDRWKSATMKKMRESMPKMMRQGAPLDAEKGACKNK